MASRKLPNLRNPIKAVFKRTAPLLRIPYDQQLKIKEVRLHSMLKHYVAMMRRPKRPQTDAYYANVKKFNGLPCAVEPFRYSTTEHYRNKNNCSVGFDTEGEIRVGHSILYKNAKEGISRIVCVPVNDLPTTKQSHAKVFLRYEEFVRQSKFVRSSIFDRWGTIMVRSNEKGQVMVHICFRDKHLSENEIDDVKEEIMQKFVPSLQASINLTSFYWMRGSLYPSVSASAFPSERLWGNLYLEETLLGKRFLISPRSFFQVNTGIAKLLYSGTAELLRTDKRTVLLDVCCGTGTIGIILSSHVSKVIGVDVDISALMDAKRNAQLNNADNVEHVCADAEEFLSQLVTDGALDAYEHVVAVVNPHRTGLSARLMRKLRMLVPLKQVVYLSCLPEGRPLTNFVRLSSTSKSRVLGPPFLLNRVIPLDPFPHTRYIEVILNFER